jgi:hypothetical protein
LGWSEPGGRTLKGVLAEAVRRRCVEKIELVKLIEGEAAKLSPRGKELWEEMELLVELNPEDRNTLAEMSEITNRMVDLPLPDQHTLERLMELLAGLYDADEMQTRGESGEGRRGQAVRIAAGIKDRHEGRQIDPDMTVEQAAARLRES